MKGASERAAFREGVITLLAAWSKRPDERLLDAWWDVLADLELRPVLEGMKQAVQSAGQFMPSVGAVRQAALKAQGAAANAPLTPQQTAALMAGEVWCEHCEDSSWIYLDEPHPAAGGRHGIATYRPDATRTRVARCRCWPTNPFTRARRPRPITEADDP